MNKKSINEQVNKFWPIIAPWAVVNEDWIASLASNKIYIDDVERTAIWLETVYCGVVLARKTMDIKLSRDDEAEFEKELFLWISDMSSSIPKEGKNIKKGANVLLKDFQKRKPILSRHEELGDYSVAGNFFGLLKNGVGHKIPDDILTEYAEFKVKLFKELCLHSSDNIK